MAPTPRQVRLIGTTSAREASAVSAFVESILDPRDKACKNYKPS